MDPIRIVIEMADSVISVTANQPIDVLLVRYDDLLADAQSEDCPVAVGARLVEQLYRTHGGDN